MKVILLDYTGNGHPDPLFAGRLLAYTKNTRLSMEPEGFGKFMHMPEVEVLAELAYVANTIRSSWEFIDFTFQVVGVSRAFTHQLVRTRTASYAQQAQRVVDMTEFETIEPPTIIADPALKTIWDKTMAHIADGYAALRSGGAPAQDARGVLPTNVSTNICTKLNLRTFADLVGKRENLRAQGEYANVVREMKALVLGVMPWTAPFLNPERLATPALDLILKGALGTASPIDAPGVNAALKELDALKGTWG